jgi:D-alanine-D-alanine ligase
MSKIRVAVIRGGFSDEYKVSLWTGAAVLENIDRSIFEPLDIIISRNGEWLYQGKAWLPEHLLHSVDVVFNALHGKFGEDGTIQRVLDRYAVPYTGSKALASSIAMHKVATKDFLRGTDIKMAPHLYVKKNSVEDVHRIAEKITDMFGPQYIIKPVSSGSSVGTMMVKNPLLLPQALEDALSTYEEVMVEARIPGREATCGVIERYRGESLYALPPTEIVTPINCEFFDSENKYNGEADEICPARFDHNTKEEIMRLTRLVHQTLNLSQYSRSDFIVASDAIYFLEVNTLPGLTKQSLLPKAIEAVGGSYSEFITHLIDDALRTSGRSVTHERFV